MKKSVVIAGMCHPYGGEHADEIWTVNRAYKRCVDPNRITRVYYFDREEHFVKEFVPELAKLEGVQVWTRDVHPEIPNSRKYPLDEVVEKFGRRYFTCSVAYMIAHAVFEGYERIFIHGCYHPTDSWEYMNAKPCVEYWCGVAEGRGVEVEMIDQSALLRCLPWETNQYGYYANENSIIGIDTMRAAYTHAFEAVETAKRYARHIIYTAFKCSGDYPAHWVDEMGKTLTPETLKEVRHIVGKHPFKEAVA